MDARFSAAESASDTRRAPEFDALLNVTTMATTALLLVVGLFLAIRRWQGAMQRPLDAMAFAMAAIVVILISTGLHQAWTCVLRSDISRRAASAREDSRFVPCLVEFLVSLIVVLYATSISLAGTTGWGLTTLWVCVLGQLTYHWISVSRRPRGTVSDRREAPFPISEEAATESIEDSLEEPLTAERDEPSADEEVLDDHPDGRLIQQRLTRALEADGTEIVFGRVRGEVETGQRNVNLHLSFCPPLTSVPEFWVEQIDGPSATVQVSQIETYGARIDVRLRTTATAATTVIVEFYGRVALNRAVGA